MQYCPKCDNIMDIGKSIPKPVVNLATPDTVTNTTEDNKMTKIKVEKIIELFKSGEDISKYNVDIKKVTSNAEFGKLKDEEKNHLSKLAIERHKNKLNTEKEETKNKIRNSLIKYYENNEIKNKNSIMVQQYDINNNLLNTYNSLSDAAKAVEVAQISIARTSNPNNTNYKTCKGYIWKRI